MGEFMYVICFLAVYISTVNTASLINDFKHSSSRLGQESSARYFVSRNSVRAFDARQICESVGGRLATIQTNDDIETMQKVLPRETERNTFWIGGQLSDDQSCTNKPFNSSCWYWNIIYDDGDEYPYFYDSPLIQFSDKVKSLRVVYPTSYMTIVYDGRLKLDISDISEHHPFICDLKSTI